MDMHFEISNRLHLTVLLVFLNINFIWASDDVILM